MSQVLLKCKATMLALQVKPVLLTVPALVLTLLSTGVAQAEGLGMGTGLLLQTSPAIECYPVPNQGGGPLDGLPPASINPVDWIGWVLGQLCKAVATVFFTLTNQVINWGTGCSQAGINFVTETPNYIRLDASKAANWQLFFWDGSFIGAALLLQFTWTALSIIWNRQLGNGYAGAQEAITRALLGGFLLLISATVLDWAVSFCNLLNGLFASRLSLFDPKSFQVDANGNIFNTILSMAAALASLLLVMQMATRYIYLILLQFIFPVGSILWINRGTQGYARLLFTSFVATLFVQPLQLAVIYITSNLKDGTRDDTSLSMLFGICGLFLALGLPRVMGSVLGGGTPVGAWGIFAISRMAAGGISGAVRGISRSGGGNSGGNGGSGNGGRKPSPSGGSGGSSGGGNGNGGSNGTNSRPGSATGTGRSSQNSPASNAAGANETPTGADESLRYGGVGQAPFRNSSKPSQNGASSQNYQGATQSNNPAREGITTTSEASPTNPKSPGENGNNSVRPLPLTSQSRADANSRTNEASNVPTAAPGSGQNFSNPDGSGSSITPTSPANGAFASAQKAGSGGGGERVEPTTVYRNKNGLMPRSSLGKDNSGFSGSNISSPIETSNSGKAPGPTTSKAGVPFVGAGREDLVGRQTMSRVSRSRPSGYRPTNRRPRSNRREEANHGL